MPEMCYLQTDDDTVAPCTLADHADSSLRILDLDADDFAQREKVDLLVSSVHQGAPAFFVQPFLSIVYNHVNPAKISELEALISRQPSHNATMNLIPRIQRKYKISLIRTFGKRPIMVRLARFFGETPP